MLIIRWKDSGGKWQDFNVLDILHLPRNHALALFRQGTAVVIKQDNLYIVNKADLYADYQKARKNVIMFSKCSPSEEILAEVGFV